MIYKIPDFNIHLDAQQVEEIVFGADERVFRQGAFPVDVCLAELFFADRHSYMLIALPQHFRPMHRGCVDGAAIIENKTFDSVEGHDGRIWELMGIDGS